VGDTKGGHRCRQILISLKEVKPLIPLEANLPGRDHVHGTRLKQLVGTLGDRKVLLLHVQLPHQLYLPLEIHDALITIPSQRQRSDR
jgi:hypothetical protein